jgi:hypothetical protein
MNMSSAAGRRKEPWVYFYPEFDFIWGRSIEGPGDEIPEYDDLRSHRFAGEPALCR